MKVTYEDIEERGQYEDHIPGDCAESLHSLDGKLYNVNHNNDVNECTMEQWKAIREYWEGDCWESGDIRILTKAGINW